MPKTVIGLLDNSQEAQAVAQELHEQMEAVAVMKRHGAVDIEQRAAGWKREGWNGKFAEAPAQAKRSDKARKPRADGARAGAKAARTASGWDGEDRRRGLGSSYRGAERRTAL